MTSGLTIEAQKRPEFKPSGNGGVNRIQPFVSATFLRRARTYMVWNQTPGP